MGNKTKVYSQIIGKAIELSKLAQKSGINNVFQVGLIREIIIANTLGHILKTGKRDADAYNPKDATIVYEYLTCNEGGSGQIDRMFSDNRRYDSLKRISRNHKIFLAVFYKSDPLKIKLIFEIKPDIALSNAEYQLNRTQNIISHISFSEKWARTNGKIVYENVQ